VEVDTFGKMRQQLLTAPKGLKADARSISLTTI